MGAVKQAWLAGRMPLLGLRALPPLVGPPAPAWCSTLDYARRCFESGEAEQAYGLVLLAEQQGAGLVAEELWEEFDAALAAQGLLRAA